MQGHDETTRLESRPVAVIERVPFAEGTLTGTLTPRTSWPDGGFRNVYVDVTGREVRVLVNGRRESGRHEVQLVTDRLANGVYRYVLRSGSAVESRKLLVRR